MQRGMQNEFVVAALLWKWSKEHRSCWKWEDCQKLAKSAVEERPYNKNLSKAMDLFFKNTSG